MPRIVEEAPPYDGALERVDRLGLGELLAEARDILTGFTLLVKEQQDANGGAAVRKLIDKRFEAASGWTKKQTGGVDWTKCRVLNGVRVCLGVEVQFSGRSDLVVVDLIHLRTAIVRGQIDLGLLVVPRDRLGRFLTDRGPKMADAKRHAREARVEDLPLLIWALEHDGPGPPLAKQAKKASGTYPTTPE